MFPKCDVLFVDIMGHQHDDPGIMWVGDTCSVSRESCGIYTPAIGRKSDNTPKQNGWFVASRGQGGVPQL